MQTLQYRKTVRQYSRARGLPLGTLRILPDSRLPHNSLSGPWLCSENKYRFLNTSMLRRRETGLKVHGAMNTPNALATSAGVFNGKSDRCLVGFPEFPKRIIECGMDVLRVEPTSLLLYTVNRRCITSVLFIFPPFRCSGGAFYFRIENVPEVTEE
ncbi:unnamed protein product [Nesidiocoris tenuis]|uniref:Uncharacterized protein n=1 Tax=Nesidiocoris tenuis TaxID=355587 RepID=A0A6H5GY17_9HEMI|nr:unnamed protein product [Nesidiocoris tenuis]